MDMKKTNRLLLLALSFSVSLSFMACSSLDDAESDGVAQESGGVVKAEFTISFPKQMGKMTRQGLDIVQGQSPSDGGPVFRGLQWIELRPFDTVAENVGATSTLLLISLSKILLINPPPLPKIFYTRACWKSWN